MTSDARRRSAPGPVGQGRRRAHARVPSAAASSAFRTYGSTRARSSSKPRSPSDTRTRNWPTNLRRAAELTRLSDAEVLGIYEALRPRRSSQAELEDLATSLSERGLPRTAALVRRGGGGLRTARAGGLTPVTVVAGIDVGNATTEVVAVRYGAHGPEVIGADRLPTRGRKGSLESLQGAAALVRRLERALGTPVDSGVVAPLRAVETSTLSVPELAPATGRLRLVASAVGTPGGRGACIGTPLTLEALEALAAGAARAAPGTRVRRPPAGGAALPGGGPESPEAARRRVADRRRPRAGRRGRARLESARRRHPGRRPCRHRSASRRAPWSESKCEIPGSRCGFFPIRSRWRHDSRSASEPISTMWPR